MKFPYEYRGEQRRMIEDIRRVLEAGGHIIIEAPTGFGKTVCALYPAVEYALNHDKKVIYLVRTNSQEQKVVEEAKKIGVDVAPLQGRNKMCPLFQGDEELSKGNPEELYLLCSKLRKDVRRGNLSSCVFYANYLRREEDLKIPPHLTAEEIYDVAVSKGICPYEVLRDIVGSATVVVAPYIYFFIPFIRNSLFERMDITPRDVILIIDEAHNIPDFAREIKSDSLSVESLERMERECIEYGNPVILDNHCSDLAEFLKESIYSVSEGDEEVIVPEYGWEEEIANLAGIGINSVGTLALRLMEVGALVRERKMEERKLPRSYIYHAGTFVYRWRESYGYEYLHLAKKGNNPSLEIYCLDPSSATEILRGVYSSISMSGTLDMEIYRNLVGLPEDTVMRSYSSPFSEENRKIVYVDDVTTRYGEVDSNVEKIAKYIDEVLSFGKNTLVLFPSYNVMAKVMGHIRHKGIVDDRSKGQKTLIESIEHFRKLGGVIFSVFGGRISEGMDFPGKQLEVVIIAGIPYPMPTPKTKVLEKYYDYKFGNGWDYVFKNAAKIKMLQAIGRLIRTPEDRGMVIILDKRIVSFPEIRAVRVENLREEMEKFFNERKRGGGASS